MNFNLTIARREILASQAQRAGMPEQSVHEICAGQAQTHLTRSQTPGRRAESLPRSTLIEAKQPIVASMHHPSQQSLWADQVGQPKLFSLSVDVCVGLWLKSLPRHPLRSTHTDSMDIGINLSPLDLIGERVAIAGAISYRSVSGRIFGLTRSGRPNCSLCLWRSVWVCG